MYVLDCCFDLVFVLCFFCSLVIWVLLCLICGRTDLLLFVVLLVMFGVGVFVCFCFALYFCFGKFVVGLFYLLGLPFGGCICL